LLKPEITQKVKFVQNPNTHQDMLANQSSAIITEKPSGLAKLAALFGNRRSRTSAVMLGLAVSLGISSFPANYLDSIATATESRPNQIAPATLESDGSADRYVEQLRNDVAAMQPQPAQTTAVVLVAQAAQSRNYPSSVANRTDTNSLQFSGEASVPIDVAAPKTKTFKSVATAPQYINPSNAGYEGDLGSPEDKYPVKANDTNIGFSWPAAGKLTSRFGRRWGRMHKGIDIAGPIGTPINAAADGTVIAAGWNSGGYGNLVEVRHSDGTTTRYGHNSRLSVSIGQSVRQGQQVAEMGSTGHSTGSHLHFEIRPSGGAAVNPISHLPANS
jgi:murein DD-endopeptidase MepM/ murein hydrolase activator NlpD